MRNVLAALDACGAACEDLARLTMHVVGWEPSMLDELGAGLFAAKQPWIPVPVTLLGAQGLFDPSMLIEIEAIAVRT